MPGMGIMGGQLQVIGVIGATNALSDTRVFIQQTQDWTGPTRSRISVKAEWRMLGP